MEQIMELRPQENWINVVDKAHGKYVLFVSDEDDVVIGALEHYLNIIKNETEISLIRAKTKIQYSSLNYQRGSKGLEAFSKRVFRTKLFVRSYSPKARFFKCEYVKI
ncbi:MAG: hypothetical protein ACLUS5_11380 [Roseburia faecis]